MTDELVEHVTCLGCGCGCDDIAVSVREGRIVEISPSCTVSKAWFGDGILPWNVLRGGQPSDLDGAVSEAARILAGARGRVLVYIGADLAVQAQRMALGAADLLGATVDTGTSDTAAGGLLAAQRRGRATATLGEVRNRGDVLLFWGTDARRYPRFHSRYALEPIGIQVPGGRNGRFVIATHVGPDQGPEPADASLTLEPDQEIAALSLMRAAVLGRPAVGALGPLKEALELVPHLLGARYAVLIHDAEPTSIARNPLRVEGLIALTQALNGPTRAALLSLRAGGNQTGAESALTWQTGFPISVDFSRGYPRYVPEDRGLDRLKAGALNAALVLGSCSFDQAASTALGRIDSIAIGPRASQLGFPTRVAIDTGVAGIHDGGVGYRMDEVPLPLRPPLQARRSTLETLGALTRAIKSFRRPA